LLEEKMVAPPRLELGT